MNKEDNKNKGELGEREIGTLERELRLAGRHSAMGSSHDCPPGDRLERSAYLLLSRIELEGPLSIGQLTEAFGLDTSTVNRQTAALLRAGYAERIPDPAGGIARKLRMTDEGMRRLHANRAWARRGLGEVLADWSPDDIAVLADALMRFNTTLEEKERRSWPRPNS